MNTPLISLSALALCASMLSGCTTAGQTIADGSTPMPKNLPQNQKNEQTPIVESTLPDLDESYAQGETLYQTNCSTCHGTSLGGRKGLGPPFVHGYYKPGHHSDIAFYRAVELGVPAHHWPFGNMPAVPSLSKVDATEIIKYIRAVQRANGIS